MNDFDLIIELHKAQHRQGPGSKDITLKAFSLTGFSTEAEIKILDIGCGTGAQTIDLAMHTHASITALDFSSKFLKVLSERAHRLGLSERITICKASMDQLDFEKESFDLIWSEGAIYNLGFEKGLQYWKQFLKPGGVFAVSEIAWIRGDLPRNLVEYWKQAYSDIDFVSSKIQVLEQCSLKPLGHIVLPENCWTDEYYTPLQNRFESFIKEYGKEAELLVQIEEDEIELYKNNKDFFSYGFFIAQKI
jgi:ubiquinone/menaquinone biosynthesis C-methylase UbiE